jgi:serine/threonine protein kinase
MGQKLGKDAYKYKKEEDHFIGSGAYSTVFWGTRKHDKLKVAIKISKDKLFALSFEKKQGLYEEIANSKSIDHPFIVKFIDSFEDKDGYFCIVQELYPEGDFYKYLNERNKTPFSE